MPDEDSSVPLKKFCHLMSIQLNSILLKTYFKTCLAVLGFVDYDFAFLFFIHEQILFCLAAKRRKYFLN